MSRPRVVVLDYTERDTGVALDMLCKMDSGGEIAGMVFAIKLKGGGKHRRLTGATGSLAANADEGAGVAGVLHLQLVRQAADN